MSPFFDFDDRGVGGEQDEDSGQFRSSPRIWRKPLREAMVWIPGGVFTMGSDDHYPEERPARRVAVDGFWIDPSPVTNRQFAQFVDATGYVTFAELPPDSNDYPGADPALLVASSMVFSPPRGAVDLRHHLQWWAFVQGANWRRPYGPGSDLQGLGDHPVVHVAWIDIKAYAAWAGWKSRPKPSGNWRRAAALTAPSSPGATPSCRTVATWPTPGRARSRTRTPWTTAGRGPRRSAPIRPTAMACYDMIGNTWEWTADWWSTPEAGAAAPRCCAAKNPRGGREEDSCEAEGPPIPRKVLKGGSHLCAPSYCKRYRPAARHAQPIDTSASHVGFRCVVRSRA